MIVVMTKAGPVLPDFSNLEKETENLNLYLKSPELQIMTQVFVCLLNYNFFRAVLGS